MIAQHPFGSPAFNQVAKGMIELHRLMKEGKDDSPEADAVRDAMDAPYAELNKQERERIGWLSEDLYSISDPPDEVVIKEMNPQSLRYLMESFEAREKGYWDSALAILRRWRSYIEPVLLSVMRGEIWQLAGNFDVATEFYGHAVSCEPSNPKYLNLYILSLWYSDPAMAQKASVNILNEETNNTPAVIARAAGICIQAAKQVSDPEAAKVSRWLVPILERNVERLKLNSEVHDGEESAHSLTISILGFCHECLGDVDAAVEHYTNALEFYPDDEVFLITRAIHLYGKSSDSIMDFERTVKLGSKIIWPYFFLANHYLTNNRFEACRKMCESGLRREGPDTAKSQLEEWHAIAQAELGFSPDLVLKTFDAAIALDPANERAKRNKATFEQNFKPAQPTHAQWEQKPVEEIRQFGLNERRYFLAA
ncbi:tetratricopeptide repeat protein [Blastopirellula marina]|uniref:Tetratricopeptide repeat protein n=1 Tax=Blastopirellula marina DSM 3645 TaxID=314230 RepID=A3ZN66_9BACT|nr:tetratricopeptide repeat protein [Blastopirellula marina]EAQ81758.1 hypothetical protein DSM3645_16440 [Blastopirellula marina DSM 3645]